MYHNTPNHIWYWYIKGSSGVYNSQLFNISIFPPFFRQQRTLTIRQPHQVGMCLGKKDACWSPESVRKLNYKHLKGPTALFNFTHLSQLVPSTIATYTNVGDWSVRMMECWSLACFKLILKIDPILTILPRSSKGSRVIELWYSKLMFNARNSSETQYLLWAVPWVSPERQRPLKSFVSMQVWQVK